MQKIDKRFIEVEWSDINTLDAASIPYDSTSSIKTKIDSVVGGAHVQNTDTGTESTTFQIDSDNTGPKLKNVDGTLQIRNALDNDDADLQVQNLTVNGTQTIVNSEEVEIADNIILLNSDVTTGVPIVDAGIEIRRGDETNASMIWDEANDVWKSGIKGSEYELVIADQSNGSAIFVSGTSGPLIKNSTGTIQLRDNTDANYADVECKNLSATGVISLTGTTKTDGALYAGTEDPTNTTRLNYDGDLHVTNIYSGGILAPKGYTTTVTPSLGTGPYYADITHDLEARPLHVQCYDTSTWKQVIPYDVELTSDTNIRIWMSNNTISLKVIIMSVNADLETVIPPVETEWVNTGILEGAIKVSSIIEDPSGDLFASNGAVYKSTNSGTTWTITGDITGATEVKSLIMDTSYNLYVATSVDGSGVVFKSTDFGDTWNPTGNLLDAVSVNSLIEDSSGNLFAGTYPYGNVFKSIDSGTTWTNTGNLSGIVGVNTLIEDSNNDLFAGTNSGSVFKSSDSGTTWTITGILGSAATYTVDSLLEDSSNNIFAGTSPNGDVFKSSDSGTTWTNTGNLLDVESILSLSEDSYGNLYAGTSTSTSSGAVFKSIDSGVTWIDTGELIDSVFIYSLLVDSVGNLFAGTSPNGDIFKLITTRELGLIWGETGTTNTLVVKEIIEETSSGDLFVASRDGVLKSTDLGVTWTNPTALEDSPRLEWILEDQYGNLHTGDGGGNYAIYKSTNSGVTWVKTTTPYVRTYAGLEHSTSGNLFVTTWGAVLRSTDSGVTWTNPALGGAGELNEITYVRDIMEETSTGHLFICVRNHLHLRGQIWKSEDQGVNWINMTPYPAVMGEMCIMEDSNGWIWSGGAQDGVMLKSEDSGVTWIPVQLPSTGNAYSLMTDSSDNLWVGFRTPTYAYGEICKSTDDGVTWTDVTNWDGNQSYPYSLLQHSSGNVFAGLASGKIFVTSAS